MRRSVAGLRWSILLLLSISSCYLPKIGFKIGMCDTCEALGSISWSPVLQRVIMKYLEGEGKDPATGEPLTEDDLIPVKTSKGTQQHEWSISPCSFFHSTSQYLGHSPLEGSTVGYVQVDMWCVGSQT